MRGLLVLLISLCVALPVRADSSEDREQVTEQARTLRNLWFGFTDQLGGLRIRLVQASYVGSEYDDTRVDWQALGLAVSGAVPLPNRREALALSLSSNLAIPLVDGSNDFLTLPGTRDDPLDELLDSAIRLGGRIELGRGFELIASTSLVARHELDADFSDSLAGGGSLAFDYRRGRWLRLRLGAGVGTGLDSSKARVTPVFRLRLRPHPRVWLETDGTTGQIDWDVSRRLGLRLFGGIDEQRYRLARRSGAVGSGSLELRRHELGIGVIYRISRRIRARVEAVVVLGTHVSVLDRKRNTLDGRDSREPSGALRFSFAWRPIETTGVATNAK